MKLINTGVAAEMTEETNKRGVFEASPKAQALCEWPEGEQVRDTDEDKSSKYPFKALLIGESFTVSFAESTPGTLPSLRSSASAYAKRLNRKFKVIIHNDHSCIEVARIG
ncbi:hypothetical protein [Pseudomonas phage KP1]|uniref:Uncharacterized protein n=1 Tax=Pseudomonas phage KP1 TaxID=2562463 RepID=A0A6G5QAJ4_9CAUD|nr:hypothetical protein PM391_gp34 [Pseudomonas phage KP1]QBZ71744.1 hypothetical protein [Pseudomonas phage KP1]